MKASRSIRSSSATGLMMATAFLLGALTVSTTMAFRSHEEGLLTDAYLRGLVSHLSDRMLGDGPDGYLDYPIPSYDDVNVGSDIIPADQGDLMMKEYEDNLSESMPRERLGLSLRDQEYLKHSSLFSGHGDSDDDAPSSSISSSSKPSAGGSVSSSSGGGGKSENVLPAYCNPPNPCPIGYTAEDGCLEEFENTAAFSREFQAAQDCMCDTEHMFDCPASLGGKSGNAKNRAAANMVDTALRKIMSDLQQGEHKSLVSKKFFANKYYDELSGLKERAQKAAEAAGAAPQPIKENPYLQGDKLPIAAKKGNLAANV